MDNEKISEEVCLSDQVELMRQEQLKLKQMIQLIGQLVYLGAEEHTTGVIEEGDGTLDSIFDVFYE